MAWFDGKLRKNALLCFIEVEQWGAVLGVQGELGLLHALHSPDGRWVPGMAVFENKCALVRSAQRPVQLKHGPLGALHKWLRSVIHLGFPM